MRYLSSAILIVMLSYSGAVIANTSSTVTVNFINKTQYVLITQNKSPTNYLCKLKIGALPVTLAHNCDTSNAKTIKGNGIQAFTLTGNQKICIGSSSQSFNNLKPNETVYLILTNTGPLAIAPNEPHYGLVSSGNIANCKKSN